MHYIYLILGLGFGIAGIICSIMILIEAFQDEIWKGCLCLLCGFYFLYYAIFDFEHDNKLMLVCISLFGNAIAVGFLAMAR